MLYETIDELGLSQSLVKYRVRESVLIVAAVCSTHQVEVNCFSLNQVKSRGAY